MESDIKKLCVLGIGHISNADELVAAEQDDILRRVEYKPERNSSFSYYPPKKGKGGKIKRW